MCCFKEENRNKFWFFLCVQIFQDKTSNDNRYVFASIEQKKKRMRQLLLTLIDYTKAIQNEALTYFIYLHGSLSIFC